MACLLLCYRYFLFAAFIVCNAIICSVAAWNYSLAHYTGLDLHVDIFLIFLGVLGVAFLLPVLFIDIFRKNAVASKVWFECVWVAVFWVLELAGAAAVTAIVPNELCLPDSEAIAMYACTSTRVLLAFSWLITVLLLIYLVALAVAAVSHHEDDSSVWTASVRFYPWYQIRSSLGSAPPSPTRDWQRPLALAAPQPKRVVQQANLRLSVDVEAARDTTRNAPSMFVMSQSGANIVPVSVRQTALASSEETARQASFPSPPQAEPVPSLYPEHMRSQLPKTARIPPPPPGPTPPPLGDWPRTAGRHRGLPKYEPPTSERTTAVSPPALPPRRAQPTPVTTTTSRPLPRRRDSEDSPSRQRPPPLNLDGISAFRAIDSRRGGRS